ncbi:MAG: hypothetical protein IKK92_09630 [Prevotella sp.]|nr:hypothetical protein [Prevotella sp.]
MKKSGQNKGKFIYFREGNKQRVRFLTDMDDGMEVVFHDSFERSVNVPCQESFGRDCPYCGDDSLRTRSQYVWSVYNYETKEVQLFMFPVNNCSPIPALMAMYENYGTLTDRDYVISVSGKQQSKTFSVVPMDKVKFRNEKAKPYSEKAILKMLDKAFPSDLDDEDDDEYEEKPKKKAPKSTGKKSKKHEVEEDDDYEDEDDSWEEDDDKVDYSDMSPKELYELCKEREIKAAPKKPAKFYINLLEEYDQAHEDWDDEDDDDEWEDDE